MSLSRNKRNWYKPGLDLITRFFDIREGEHRRCLWMFTYLLLFITALMIVKPVSNALFLNQFGARQLPFAYMLTAFFAATFSSLYALMLEKIPLDQLMEKTLYVAISLLMVFWIFIHFQWIQGVFLYLFFVWVGLFALICVSQFWLAAGLFFNVREAKRLFGPIGSGAIAGGILGGYVTKLLAPTLGSDNLMVISIICLFLCILIVKKLWKIYGPLEAQIRPDFKPLDPPPPGRPLSRIIHSRHLRLLAVILGISVIVSRLVDYQFNFIVTANITDTDQLAAFLGFWMSNLNFISLLIQLFVTRKVVETLGVGASLFFLPVAVFSGAVLTLFHPALWTAVMIKLNEGAFKNSLNKSGMELLFLPIPPAIKNQTKPFIDIFVDSAASGIGGLVLVFLVFGIDIAPAHISGVILLLVSVWFILIRRVKKEYIYAFKKKFDLEPDPIPNFTGHAVDSTTTMERIIQGLTADDERLILKTLQMIIPFHSESLSPFLVTLLSHPREIIRIEALKQLYFSKTVNVLDQAKTFIQAGNMDLKTEAIRYVFHHCQNRDHELQALLKDGDFRIRGAALLCLARETRKNRVMRKRFTPERLIERALLSPMTDPEQRIFTKKICIQAICTGDIYPLYPYLYILMNDPEQPVVIEAIKGAGQTWHPEFIHVLLPFLGRKPVLRDAAMEALACYGPRTLDLLSTCLSNTYVAYNIRKHLPEVIAAAGDQKAVDTLSRHLKQKDLGLRYEVIRALNHLRIKSDTLLFTKVGIVPGIKKEARDYMDMLMILYAQKHMVPSQDVPMQHPGRSQAREQLIKALEMRLDAGLERLFRLLGLKYPPVEMYSAYKGIRSRDTDVRMNAMEFLDNVLDINLKNSLMPIIETGSLLLAEGMVPPPEDDIPEEFDSYVSLLQGQDDFLKEKTLYLLSFFAEDRYIPHMAMLLNSPSRGVRRMARFALEKTGKFHIN